jgi:hypothetical protein
MATSANRIDKARYDQVMFSRVCPGCGNYVILDVVRRSKQDALDSTRSKYLGTYHCCGGPEGHGCWNMSKFDATKPDKPLYETFGDKEELKQVA